MDPVLRKIKSCIPSGTVVDDQFPTGWNRHVPTVVAAAAAATRCWCILRIIILIPVVVGKVLQIMVVGNGTGRWCFGMT